MSSKSKDNRKLKILRDGEKEVPILDFSLKRMVQYAIICIIAKRGSGKSWIVRSLLQHYHDIPVGIIICPTDLMSSFYKDFFPDLYIHYEYSSSIISGILDRQKKMLTKYNHYLTLNKAVDPRAFIVMDDCLADKKIWTNDKNMKTLFLNGRHYKIMFMLTMQFCLGILPELRDNIDYVFLLKNNKITEQQKIWKHYAGIFPNFQAFRQVFNELTKDYGSMVINNREGNDLMDTVFHFKAEKISRMNLGCKQFNRAHQNNYDPYWDEKEKKVDIDEVLNNKNKIKVNIKNKKGKNKSYD